MQLNLFSFFYTDFSTVFVNKTVYKKKDLRLKKRKIRGIGQMDQLIIFNALHP
jgi:hypothetical protein